MPTLRHSPDSNVTPEPPASSNHYYLGASGAHIYLALVAVAVFAAIRLATARSGRSQLAPRRVPKTQLQDVKDTGSPECRKDSTAAYSRRDSAVGPPWQVRDLWGVGLSFGHKPQQAVRVPRACSPAVVGTRQCQPAGQPREMEGIDDARKKDHSGSASRGVSSNNPGAADPGHHQHSPPPLYTRPGTSGGQRRASRSPPFPPFASSSRHHSGNADGAEDRESKGKGPMVGHSGWTASRPDSPLFPMFGEGSAGQLGTGPDAGGFQGRIAPEDRDYSGQPFFSRPPPPPPLTPPIPGSTGFPFEHRRPSFAISIPPDLDASFIHLTNPDYTGGSTSADVYSSSPRSTTGTPRRRSYTKNIPIGISIPTTTSASSSTETMTSGETFSPSSYPSTSPLLPPPPPGQEFPYEYEFVGGPGGPGILSSVQEIDLHGEILSVMDDAGHGWKRHTRVYGGGVCLACAAAGEQGFYGDKVPLEDRR